MSDIAEKNAEIPSVPVSCLQKLVEDEKIEYIDIFSSGNSQRVRAWVSAYRYFIVYPDETKSQVYFSIGAYKRKLYVPDKVN